MCGTRDADDPHSAHVLSHGQFRPDYTDPIDAVLQRFLRAGGRILFGTDVGYVDDYDTEGEMVADFTILETTTHPVVPRNLSCIVAVVKNGRVIFKRKDK